MYKVERAIIMAAGEGSRLRPITLTIPKPMIKVKGTRMIDTIIRALHTNGIYEIYIVIGYLKESFRILKEEYNNITLIENPYYDKCNNISSLYVAREYLEDVIIIDGDQIIFNKSILSPEFDMSGYNAAWTSTSTNEWLMTVEDGIVTSCSRNGGKNGWQLYGISRWNKKDGHRLRKHLEEEFIDNKRHDIYWDDIAMFCHSDEYKLGIKEITKTDIVEIDNLQDLVRFDSSYEGYLN